MWVWEVAYNEHGWRWSWSWLMLEGELYIILTWSFLDRFITHSNLHME